MTNSKTPAEYPAHKSLLTKRNALPGHRLSYKQFLVAEFDDLQSHLSQSEAMCEKVVVALQSIYNRFVITDGTGITSIVFKEDIERAKQALATYEQRNK